MLMRGMCQSRIAVLIGRSIHTQLRSVLENSSTLSEMFYLKEIPCLLNDIVMVLYPPEFSFLKTSNGKYGKIAK